MPLTGWGADSLSRIGNLVGDPLFADECTTNQLRVSFARILVEVDGTREMHKTVLKFRTLQELISLKRWCMNGFPPTTKLVKWWGMCMEEVKRTLLGEKKNSA